MRKTFFLLAYTLFFVAALVGQTGDLLPSENLIVDGIPPIPASHVEAVGRYTEFRSASLASWNPTKLEMLVVTRFADVPQIHHVKFPGGARQQLTFFPDRVVSASFNPKHDDYFVFGKDVGGGEWYQHYRYDVASRTITLLTDGKSKNTLGVWSNAGDRMVYGSTARTSISI
jgi:Tol biopolymer transport system component